MGKTSKCFVPFFIISEHFSVFRVLQYMISLGLYSNSVRRVREKATHSMPISEVQKLRLTKSTGLVLDYRANKGWSHRLEFPSP